MSSKIIGFFLIISLLYVMGEDSPEKQKLKEEARKIAMQCKETVGASDDDYESLKQRISPDTQVRKCLWECIFTAANIMKDGALNKDGTLEVLMPILKDDPDKLKKTTEILDTCVNDIGKGADDKCETAKLVYDCLKKRSNEAGLMKPKS